MDRTIADCSLNYNKVPRGYFENDSEISFLLSPIKRKSGDSEFNEVKKYSNGNVSRVVDKRVVIPKADNGKDNTATKTRGLRILTGNLEQIVKLSKSGLNTSVMYEVYGKVVSIQQGKFQCEKIVLLRSSDNIGLVIQGVFYEIDIKLVGIRPNDLVRCVGRFVNNSRFFLVKIRKTDHNFVASTLRLNAICNFTVNRDKLIVKKE